MIGNAFIYVYISTVDRAWISTESTYCHFHAIVYPFLFLLYVFDFTVFLLLVVTSGLWWLMQCILQPQNCFEIL